MEGVKLDQWGYEAKTCSDACIAAINSYYHQVLSYGRKRDVILEAPKADPDCVLGNILAASFLCSFDPSRVPTLIDAAKSCLDSASEYEKAVFDAVSYFISPDRDDDVAVDLHSKVHLLFPYLGSFFIFKAWFQHRYELLQIQKRLTQAELL